jgi:STIP1 family protein 1
MSLATSSSLSSSNKLKEEGNKLFMKRNYKEAIEMYTKAIEKANVSTYYINRALCYFKIQNWGKTVEDCRKAIDLDSNSVKAHFYLGQALSEMNFHDEAIVNLKKSHELTKILNENYGDEITRTIRNAKKRRWNYLEENRIKQEIELQKYLTRLMIEDKDKQLNNLKSNENKYIINDQNNKNKSENIILEEISNDNEKQINEIEQDFQQKLEELNRLFSENDARRKKREIPDYLCGKISFELMHDPVITPSGITYDRYDIEQHLHRVGRFDPITRQELTIDQLIPNLSMKEVIENFINENEWIDGAL